MRTWMLIILSSYLSACAGGLLPEAEPAPQQWLLHKLEVVDAHTPPNNVVTNVSLAVERPSAATPLRGKQIWYRNNAHQLTPFSQNIWAESLDIQLQQRVAEYLGRNWWVQTSLPDAPGYKADYRLRLNLQDWYLNLPQQQLEITLQASLLDAAGHSLWHKTWSANPAVTVASPAAMLQTSQEWLASWVLELNELLLQQLLAQKVTALD